MKIKVGDKVKLRDGREDLIIGKLNIEGLEGYPVGIYNSGDFNPYLSFEKADNRFPFISRRSLSFNEEGNYLLNNRECRHDVVEVLKEKKKFKKYNWIMLNPRTGEMRCSKHKYPSHESSKTPSEGDFFSTWIGIQVIESSEEEFEE